jgi:hypothetical protein
MSRPVAGRALPWKTPHDGCDAAKVAQRADEVFGGEVAPPCFAIGYDGSATVSWAQGALPPDFSLKFET